MKRLRVVVRPRARADLNEQALYIAQDSVDAALRFLTAAESAFEQLGAMPEIGRQRRFRHPSLVGVRSWAISGFEKHVVFYRVAQDRVDVLRVIHAARDLWSIFGSED